jgi:hypothetical protein
MHSRMETFTVFRPRSALPLCLGVAFTLTACAGREGPTAALDASPANSLESGSASPDCSEPIYLSAKVVFTDGGWPGPPPFNNIRVGSDAAHPCSWPQPAPGANEDLTKRRLGAQAPPETGWFFLNQVSDAADCAVDAPSLSQDAQWPWQYYETSGADPRYVLCPDTCFEGTLGTHVFRVWRACK